jgi:hypothetical protein
MFFSAGALRFGVGNAERISMSSTATATVGVPLQVSAGFRMGRVQVTSNTNMGPNNGTVFGVSNLSAPRILTLPGGVTAGHIFYIKDETGQANETNFIRIQCPPGVKIDGQDYYDITVGYESIMVYSNGSNWFIV